MRAEQKKARKAFTEKFARVKPDDVRDGVQLVLTALAAMLREKPHKTFSTPFDYFVNVATAIIATGVFLLRTIGVDREKIVEVADWSYDLFNKEHIDVALKGIQDVVAYALKRSRPEDN